MLVGPELPLDPGWRIVEDDLYGIAGRVREHDPDARLVREDGTGRLGLAHLNRRTSMIPGGAMMLARPCIDWDTGADLVGAPDARVIRDMRHSDSHRIANLTAWNRRRRDALAAQRERDRRERSERNAPHAEQMAWAMHHDLGWQPRISVPRDIPRTA